MKRRLFTLLVTAGALLAPACGGDSSPADTVTQPIDTAEDTAKLANQRHSELTGE